MSHVLAHLEAIPPGEGRVFQFGGQRIAVFRTRSDRVFALQADCPHRGGPLADGLLGGTTLVCPLHSNKFDLTTGKSLTGVCDLKTYAVEVDPEFGIVLTDR